MILYNIHVFFYVLVIVSFLNYFLQLYIKNIHPRNFHLSYILYFILSPTCALKDYYITFLPLFSLLLSSSFSSFFSLHFPLFSINSIIVIFDIFPPPPNFLHHFIIITRWYFSLHPCDSQLGEILPPNDIW